MGFTMIDFLTIRGFLGAPEERWTIGRILADFFGIGGFSRTPEGAWSWQHILFVSLLLTSMVALAIYFGRKNRDKDMATKNKVLLWAGILINAVELLQIFVVCFRDGWESITRLLPLFLCSIQMFAIPLAALAKGKLKESALDFVFTFGILGAVLGTIGATQNYNAYPVLSMPNVVSGVSHCISGFASLYIVISGMESMKKENLLITFAILGGFILLASLANWAFDYNYMFLNYHDETPYVIFWNLVGGNQTLYAIIVIALFVLYITVFYGVYALIKQASLSLAVEKEKQ